MRWYEAVAIVAAGGVAGAMNTIVGSGTLVTFPVLLAFGYPPVIANVSNTVGLVPGSVSGAFGYRAELATQARVTGRLAAASLLGGITGAVLLLTLPPSAFKAIVPVFIALALVLVVVQPRLARVLARRGTAHRAHGTALALVALYACGVYGGYFGAAQGVLILAILGLVVEESLQRINAIKNVLAGLTNLVAGLFFVVVADVAWTPALLIAGGAIVGAQVGARVGRRLAPAVLRGVIVAVGTLAIAKLLLD
jgi:uncharacterized membrane protein YfcA